MIGNSKLQCFCCNKKLNLISVEPDFYCYKCVAKKEIHNSENNVNPVKWYSIIAHDIKCCQTKLENQRQRIDNLTMHNRSKEIQMKRFRVETLKDVINQLKIEKEKKINKKIQIESNYKLLKKALESVNSKRLVTDNHVDKLSKDQKELIEKILTIQIYLNKIQFLFVEEIFKLFPITLCKYEPDNICDLPFHIDLSDSSVLESNDSTASAIVLLTILATSVSFILDICYSSMNIKQFAFQTICKKSTPLERDEIMRVYEFLVKTVHHITQATLFREDMNKNELTKIDAVKSLASTSSSGLSAENYPLKKLVTLRDNLNIALVMNEISNPYVLQLPNMFQNDFIGEFSVSNQLNCINKDRDIMDFEELSSIVPVDELPSYLSQNNIDNPLISEWLSWMKKGF